MEDAERIKSLEDELERWVCSLQISYSSAFPHLSLCPLCGLSKRLLAQGHGFSRQALGCLSWSSFVFQTRAANLEDAHYLKPNHITPETFENASLFLRLGLPSTLIRHENGTFLKRSSNQRNLKTSAFRFHMDRKHFETITFRNRCRYNNQVISLTGFSPNTNPKPVIG